MEKGGRIYASSEHVHVHAHAHAHVHAHVAVACALYGIMVPGRSVTTAASSVRCKDFCNDFLAAAILPPAILPPILALPILPSAFRRPSSIIPSRLPSFTSLTSFAAGRAPCASKSDSGSSASRRSPPSDGTAAVGRGERLLAAAGRGSVTVGDGARRRPLRRTSDTGGNVKGRGCVRR